MSTTAAPSKHLVLTINGPAVKDERRLQNDLMAALSAAKACVVGVQKWEFSPHGISIAVLLSESHATLHSWPEKEAALLDCFSCAANAGDQYTDFIRSLMDAGYWISNAAIMERSLNKEEVPGIC